MRNTIAGQISRAMLVALLAGNALAADYPSGPIRILVGFPPGNATDLVARVFASQLGEALKANVVVENQAGAAGGIATAAAAAAAPNGQTLLVGSSGTLAINPLLQKDVRYDPAKDFAPVAQLCSVPMYLTVTASLPAHSVAELIALAKKQPGVLNFGSSGVGSANHLIAAVVASTTGMDLTHVPYKGSVPAVNDMLAGRIAFMTETAPVVMPQAKAGKLRVLAVTKPTRSANYPEVPTLAESGYPGFDAQAWIALVAPAGTPQPILDTLGKAASQIVTSKDFASRLVVMGVEPVASTSPAEFGAYLASEQKRWKEVTEKLGLKKE
jgi:tripartite-type tricarboxylate transporter receptor subunit TctC